MQQLRRKGWSAQEVAHLNTIFSKHTFHDRLQLWLVTTVFLAGTVAVPFFLMPVLVYARLLTVPLSFLLGACLGFLLIHVLLTLRIQHHRRAMLFLILGSLLMVTITTYALLQYTLFPENPFLLSIPLALGLLVPYLTEKRLHGQKSLIGGHDGSS